MKTPKHKVEEKFKNKKDQLQLCFKIMNYFLCVEDIEHYLNIKRKKNVK